MYRGEKCILRCAPEYAYGENGSGSIGPNETLDFEFNPNCLIFYVAVIESDVNNLLNCIFIRIFLSTFCIYFLLVHKYLLNFILPFSFQVCLFI